MTVEVGVLSLPLVRGVSIRLMLAALVAAATGVATTAKPCGTEAAGEAGLTPADSCRDRVDSEVCVALRRSTCRELAALTSAPFAPCTAAPALPAPPAPVAITISPRPPLPALIAVAVLPFAPKTSPPTA